MSEMKSAAGIGNDSCAKNSVHEFKIWADVLNYGKQVLKDAGIAEADLDSWYLFEQIFGISRAQYFMCAREKVSRDSLDDKMAAYDEALKKRAAHIPLQQILGQQEFMGLTFFVNEHVLIPRQDTETLVELVLNEQKDKNTSILDMCTGSGCIAVSLKKLGRYAHVEGADISDEALKVAKRNSAEILGEEAEYNSAEHVVPQAGVTFRHSDMFSNFQETERFNMIVSNPPYIPSAVIEELEPEVRDHEPRGALDGTADGLYFYRILAEECAKHLTPGGHVYFEIGYDQGAAVKELLDIHGFKDTKVIQDLTGKDRVVCGTWQTAGV